MMVALPPTALPPPRAPGVAPARIEPTMFKIEIDHEEDGRWFGEVPDLLGVMAHGATEAEARVNTGILALRAIADRLKRGEPI